MRSLRTVLRCMAALAGRAKVPRIRGYGGRVVMGELGLPAQHERQVITGHRPDSADALRVAGKPTRRVRHVDAVDLRAVAGKLVSLAPVFNPSRVLAFSAPRVLSGHDGLSLVQAARVGDGNHLTALPSTPQPSNAKTPAQWPGLAWSGATRGTWPRASGAAPSWPRARGLPSGHSQRACSGRRAPWSGSLRRQDRTLLGQRGAGGVRGGAPEVLLSLPSGQSSRVGLPAQPQTQKSQFDHGTSRSRQNVLAPQPASEQAPLD